MSLNIGTIDTSPMTVSKDPAKDGVIVSEEPISPKETAKKLEPFLKTRADKQELVDRNILKDTNVAPSLQEAQAQLEKHRLQDALNRKIQNRPSAKELEEHHILKNTNIAPSLQAAQADLEMAQKKDKLKEELAHRPEPEEVVKKGYMKEQDAPAH